MQVSVIIPTYNRASLLKRALQSVFNQSYAPMEVIVVDDGSTDETKEVASSFDIVYLKTTNRGVSAARNLGIKKARGEWIAFLDSDDEWLPHKLSEQKKMAVLFPSLKIIHGEEIWIRRGKRVNQMKKHRKYGGYIFEKCLELCLISPSAVMIHRDVFKAWGTFNEEFIVCEDYELWLRLTSVLEVGFIPEPIIVKYGGHKDQLSSKYFAMDYWRVKALTEILKNRNLEELSKKRVEEVIQKKTEILLKGYKKHKNFGAEFEEISNISSNLKK